jgi:hypothetical protein
MLEMGCNHYHHHRHEKDKHLFGMNGMDHHYVGINYEIKTDSACIQLAPFICTSFHNIVRSELEKFIKK